MKWTQFPKNSMNLLDKERDGQPFPGESRQSLYGIAEITPLLTDLVEDDRIYKTVESLLGEGFMWLCSEGNLYVGDTDWHPDGTRLEYRPMKVSLYLDPLTKETGCLRVIPGSHRLPPCTKRSNPARSSVSPAPMSPVFPLESQPGDVFFCRYEYVACILWRQRWGVGIWRSISCPNPPPQRI